jgi:hypothetical protein
MRKISLALIVFLVIAACQAVTSIQLPTWPILDARRASPTLPTGPTTFPPLDTPTPLATVPVFPTDPPPMVTVTPAPAGSLPAASGFTVRIHPENGVYVGDHVSFEVITPGDQPFSGESVKVELASTPLQELGEQKLGRYGIGGREQATFLWAWNTTGLVPADYQLTFTVLPGGLTFTETLTLLPAADLPASDFGAAWAEARSQCCIVQYITGTEAERDLPALLLDMDAQASDASNRMGIGLTVPITVTLIPRVLGHGGFTSSEIGISYLDRNYAGGSLGMILHHELVHVLDGRLGGDLRPSLLVEGLAVYQSGGHYKPEPLLPRAAALLDQYGDPAVQGLDWYIPLETLADQFYASQHEIGYLEAGALIEYMVQRWGWQDFSTFYRDIHPAANGSQARAMDDALRSHFELSLAELEEDFLAALRRQPVTSGLREDVRLTVQLYDTLRRYQQALDPSAYFLNAWLLDTVEMRKRGIVADYLRHPETPLNIEIETMLQQASGFLLAADYTRAGESIEEVNALLDLINE